MSRLWQSPQGNSAQLHFVIHGIFQQQQSCSISETEAAVPASSRQPGSMAAAKCAAGALQVPTFFSGTTMSYYCTTEGSLGVRQCTGPRDWNPEVVFWQLPWAEHYGWWFWGNLWYFCGCSFEAQKGAVFGAQMWHSGGTQASAAGGHISVAAGKPPPLDANGGMAASGAWTLGSDFHGLLRLLQQMQTD